MRLPLEWLGEYCDAGLPVRDLVERLTMTGTKVEARHHHGVGELDSFVVGKVLAADKHPDADRLTVCRVDVGEGEPAQIVCGAPNVAAGQTVAVARPGAVMPDGTKLGRAKLRGVESDGMILAEDELAIGTLHAGTMELEEGPAPGTPLADVLPIATEVLELEITPNRPDCLGVYGVSREVHAATGAALAPPPWAGTDLGPAQGIDGVSIEVRDPDLCPRFTAVAFTNVSIAESPPWLKARLMAAGQRPISNVVDITNYVMLLTAQPLHAFDLDKVAGGTLVVRRARDGEEIRTLDDQTRSMPPDGMLIEDAEGPTSIAGIMGGERSEVSDETTRVLMEVATWVGPNIHATSNALGLRSEASTRFEKGLSPESTVEAQIVAKALMVQLCGATALSGWIDAGGPGPEPQVIRTREANVTGLLGVAVARERQREVLGALGFGVADAGTQGDSPGSTGLDVSVPHWRRLDVTREADVIEEVARLAVLEDLPATLPRGRPGARLTEAQRLRRRAEDVLVGRGLDQVAGWSFAAPSLPDRLRLPADSPLRRVVTVENPMSEEESILRPSVLGSLLDAAQHNMARGRERIAIFESGTVYRAHPMGSDATTPAHEHHALATLLIGPLTPATWGTPDPPAASFFAAKGLLEAVLDTLRVDWEVVSADEPYLHPGRAAHVRVAGGERLGWLGELHPLVARAWDVDGTAAGFAVDLGKVIAAAPGVVAFADVTSFPPVREDLAVVMAGDVPAGDVVAAVRGAGGELLRSASVFDRYDMGEGRVSLAIHLEFAAPDRTLTDKEVAGVRDQIVKTLADRVGAVPRA